MAFELEHYIYYHSKEIIAEAHRKALEQIEIYKHMNGEHIERLYNAYIKTELFLSICLREKDIIDLNFDQLTDLTREEILIRRKELLFRPNDPLLLLKGALGEYAPFSHLELFK